MPMGKGTYGTKKGRPKSAGTKGRVARRTTLKTAAAKSKIAKSPAKKLGKSVTTLKKKVGITTYKPRKPQGTQSALRRIPHSDASTYMPKVGTTARTAGRVKRRNANKRK